MKLEEFLKLFSLALLSWKKKRNNCFPARKFVLRSTFFQVTLIGNLHTCIFKETFEGQNNYLLFGVRGESGKPNIIFILDIPQTGSSLQRKEMFVVQCPYFPPFPCLDDYFTAFSSDEDEDLESVLLIMYNALCNFFHFN